MTPPDCGSQTTVYRISFERESAEARRGGLRGAAARPWKARICLLSLSLWHSKTGAFENRHRMRARSRPSVPLLLLQNHTHLRYGRLHKEKRGKNRFWCTRGESEDGKKNKEKQTGSERALSLFFLSLSQEGTLSLTGKRFSHCHQSSLPAWTRLTSTPERGASQETTGLTRLSWQSLGSFLFPFFFSPLPLKKRSTWPRLLPPNDREFDYYESRAAAFPTKGSSPREACEVWEDF
jgi:hypothetical protein